MRIPLIAGNWKMNLNKAEAVALARGIAAESRDIKGAELLVCPPHVYLDAVGAAIAGSTVALGAQNMYYEGNGAYTGETSAAMLLDLRSKYVILGHSERRHILGETDQEINKKTLAALAAGLVPIVCVGELLEQREAGQTAEVNARQCNGSLAGLTAEQMAATVVAYEPVWAIGTGKVATPEQAQEVHADLRKLLADRYNPQAAAKVRILYGGSVKPDNARELMSLKDVDGALIGGASLKADSFLAIARASQG
jgi:triosephosphate isomerase